MAKAEVTRMQYFCLIPNLLFGKAIGITAGVFARRIGADTWTSMLIGFVFGIIVLVGMTGLCSKYPDKTIVEFSEVIMGKWAGKGIGIILTLFFAVSFAVSANVMTLHIKEYFLVDTPMFMICLIYILLCMYGTFLGIEVVVRFSLLGLLMCFSITIFMFVGTLEDFKVANLLPLFDKGVLNNISNSIYIFSDFAMAVLALGFTYPLLNNKKKVLSTSFGAALVGLILIVPWPLFETGVMGAGAMKNYVVVCMQQIRCAELARYLPRYEVIMVSFFAFSVFVQSATMLYCSVYSFKQVTGIKKNGVIIIPLTVILVAVTYIMTYDHNDYVHFLEFPWTQICVILSIGLPIILFFTALARGKLKKQKKTSR